MPAISAPVPVPSPFGGLNTRDGVSALQPQEARELENLDPEGNAVKPRKGRILASTSAESAQIVGTLAAYDGDTSSKLIGVTGGKVIDFTGATAVILYDGMYTDGHFRTECYNNYLIGVNGTDIPWSFNGTTVGASGFSGSGLTITNLNSIKKVRNRLWFTEKYSADVWYGATEAVTGTLTKFQLSQVTRGGTCLAIGSHSQDAGAGPDDYTVFVMSTGEVVVYSGDPTTTFSKVGNYDLPPPVGQRCIVNIGGPLAVLTRMGLVPIQSAVSGIAFSDLAIGDYGKVGPSIKINIEADDNSSVWHVVLQADNVIINAPITSTTMRQWVFKTLGGKWTTWTGFNTHAMCVYSNELYFGGLNGEVYKRYGSTDLGAGIAVKSRGAFVIPPGGKQVKATAFLPSIKIEGTLTGKYGLDQDSYPAR